MILFFLLFAVLLAAIGGGVILYLDEVQESCEARRPRRKRRS